MIASSRPARLLVGVIPGCGADGGDTRHGDGHAERRSHTGLGLGPDTYAVELFVTGLVDPYTYSDMTGKGLQLVLPQ